ncbi:MAG: hypothetical protein GY765_17625 [bacterium]|nr:hypothetical protein [bacterium]
MKREDLQAHKDRLEARVRELEKENQRLEKKIDDEAQRSRKQEQVMMKQTRLAAMGQMVTAIAHKWRQPLTAIGFIMQNIKNAYMLGKLDKEFMEESSKEAMRQIDFMSKTVDELQIFLIPAKDKKKFDARDAVYDTLSILQAKLQNNAIRVHLESGELHCAKIFGFPNEFKQVLLNIVNNAVYAIRKKIDKDLMEAHEGKIRIDILLRDNLLVIRIFNNGELLTSEFIDRIFEPFYSTKEKAGDKGMGVGLYMAKIIIEENMGGRIYAENAEKGVSFILELKAEN